MTVYQSIPVNRQAVVIAACNPWAPRVRWICRQTSDRTALGRVQRRRRYLLPVAEAPNMGCYNTIRTDLESWITCHLLSI